LLLEYFVCLLAACGLDVIDLANFWLLYHCMLARDTQKLAASPDALELLLDSVTYILSAEQLSP